MGVLHTGILIGGLAAVSLPIIIHLLLRRRKRPVAWGAMRFVLEAYRKTQRRTNIQRLLLLTCRCLLVAAIGVALARPLISGTGAEGGDSGGRTVWFVIDDGLIGQTSVDGTSDVQRAVEHSKSLVATLGPGDRVGVVLAGTPARALVSPASGNLAGVASALEGVAAGDGPSDLRGALGLVSQAIMADRMSAPAGRRGSETVVLAQTARAGMGRVGESLDRLPSGVGLVVAEGAQGATSNVAVVDVRALRPVLLGGQAGEAAQTVTVRLKRSGPGVERGVRTTVTVRLLGIQTEAGRAVVEWTAGQREATATVVIDAGPIRDGEGAESGAVLVTAVETSADAISGDNLWRLPVQMRDTLRVGVLADSSARGSSLSGGTADRFRPGQWIRLALRPSESSPVEVVELEPLGLDTATLSDLDAVVVLSPEAVAPGQEGWGRLARFADSGGLILVTPPAEVTVQPWAEAMAVGLGVPFTVGRGAKEFPAEAPGRLVGSAVIDPGSVDLLATLRGELEALARPVAVLRAMVPLENSGEDNEGTRVLIRLEQGDAFLTLLGRKGGAGAVLYLASPLDLRWTDLPAKPLMVPLVQELVRQGVGRARPVFMSTAGGVAVAPRNAVELRPVGMTGAALKATGGASVEPVRLAGVWSAATADGRNAELVAVNAADVGDTSIIERAPLESWLSTALPTADGDAARPVIRWAGSEDWVSGLSGISGSEGVNRVGTGSMLLLLALGLALVEVLLARMVSTPSQSGSRSGLRQKGGGA